MTEFDRYVMQRSRETRKQSIRRYLFWCCFIAAVFSFCLGVLVGANV